MSHHTVFDTACRLQQAQTPYAMVSVIKALAPASARPGDKAVVTAEGALHGWIGGGCAQPAVVRTVRLALADGRARVIRIAPTEDGFERDLGDVMEFGMACHSGGTLELFIDPVLPQARLVVIGDSPVAASLAQLAPHVGLAVTVVAHQAEAAAFPHAQQVLASDDAATAVPQIAAGAWVVVATQGRRDVQGLRLALALQARQVSFVASARKAQVLKASLVAAGAAEEAVAAIVAPAGLAVAATTPQEIALSVLAAVIAHRRGAAPLPAAVEAAGGVAGEMAGEMAGEAAAGAAMAAVPGPPTGVDAPAKVSCCSGAVAALPPLPAVRSSCCGG